MIVLIIHEAEFTFNALDRPCRVIRLHSKHVFLRISANGDLRPQRLADDVDLLILAVNVIQLGLQVDASHGQAVPARAFGNGAAGEINDLRVIRAHGGHDIVHIVRGVSVEEVAAIIRGCPYDQLRALVGQRLPSVAPADVETRLKADAAKICVEHGIVAARNHHGHGGLFIHRVHLAIPPHRLARAIQQEGGVITQRIAARIRLVERSGDVAAQLPGKPLQFAQHVICDPAPTGIEPVAADFQEGLRQHDQVGLITAHRFDLVHDDRHDLLLRLAAQKIFVESKGRDQRFFTHGFSSRS